MKVKILFVFITIFFSLLILFYTFGQQKAQWKGTVEYEDGVKVIKNPKEPLYGEIEFDLEEDLVIGNEEDENYSFFRHIGIAVDSEQNIFVLDKGNHRIQKYDHSGKFLKSIGNQGQGPGELDRPARLFIDSEGDIFVHDRQHIDVFDKNGKFQRIITLRNFLLPFAPMESVSFRAFLQYSDQMLPGNNEKGSSNIILLDSEGKNVKTIASFPFEYPPPLKDGGRLRYLLNPCTHETFYCPINEQLGIYGHSSQYKLYGVNSSGKITFIIKKSQLEEPFTKKEKNQLLNREMEQLKSSEQPSQLSRNQVKSVYKFPSHKPFFEMITKDDKSLIYVQHFKLLLNDDKTEDFDVFNQAGYYLYKVKMPFFPRLIKHGFIYQIAFDQETGYWRVIRYKIKNWDNVKTGF